MLNGIQIEGQVKEEEKKDWIPEVYSPDRESITEVYPGEDKLLYIELIAKKERENYPIEDKKWIVTKARRLVNGINYSSYVLIVYPRIIKLAIRPNKGVKSPRINNVIWFSREDEEGIRYTDENNYLIIHNKEKQIVKIIGKGRSIELEHESTLQSLLVFRQKELKSLIKEYIEIEE